MKTSYILIGAAVLVVLYFVLNRKSGLVATKPGTTYTGGAGYVAAAGSAASGLGQGIAAIIDSLSSSSSDATTAE